jgi:hypothetical protein
MAKDTEPFPPLNGSHEKEMKSAKSGSVRRRKSSGLGGELPGDSDAPALATMATPPATPTESSVCLYFPSFYLSWNLYHLSTYSRLSRKH